MRNFFKLVLTAALALALATGVANASRGFSTERAENVRATATNLRFITEVGEVICNVTMNLSLHRTIAKVERTLAGYVREVNIAGCTEGSAEILDERGVQTRSGRVRWHISYESFSGTLPSITSIRLLIRNVQFLITRLVRCLYEGNALGSTVGNPVTQVRADETWQIPWKQGSFCPPEGALQGTFTVTPNIPYRLI